MDHPARVPRRAAGAILLLLLTLVAGAIPAGAGPQEPPAAGSPGPESPSGEPALPAEPPPDAGLEAGAPAPREGGAPGEDAGGRDDAEAAAGPPRIGRIHVDGNRRVSDSAFFSNLKLKSGDPFEARAVQDEFRRLWDLNLFDDITVESRQREAGVIDLIFHVRDRPIISSVAYVGMKAITESGILERLAQAKAEVRRGQPVDYSVLHKAEAAIQQLLAEQGYLEARVKARLLASSQGQREVTFYIREGGKTRVKTIGFAGNRVFTDKKLRKMLKLTKQASWWTFRASPKSLYHPAKFDQDAENIRTAYRSLGYLDLVIKPEVVESDAEVRRREREARGRAPEPEPAPIEDPDEALFWEPRPPAPAPPGETEKERRRRVKAELKAQQERDKPPKKWVHLTVPIDERGQYRVGEIRSEGNSVFSDTEIMARLPLRPGMVFNDSAVKFAVKRLEDDYGERGYFYVSIDPRIDKRETVADLTLAFTEDRRYFVDRIEFTGNTNTRDGVLRREMRLEEEDLFNVRLMRLGIRKIAQLGYFQVGEDPVVKPFTEQGKVNIEIQGTESARNEIQVGGGVSGLEGAFFQASYSTRNFLGRGEILSTFIQTGQIADRYAISFTEPYFLGKPWTLGFSLFKRQTDYVGFRRDGSGGTVTLGRLLGAFSRIDVIYGLEDVRLVTNRPGLSTGGLTTTTSGVSLIYTFDTRNNFFHPTRGLRLQTAVEYAGGFLGGDNSYVKPRFDATVYLPSPIKRHYIGLNMSYGYIRALGGRPIPTFERYYLGGERSLRLFRTRVVSPAQRDLDLNGNGVIDFPEDRNPDGIFQPCEDLNGNGVQDENETDRGNCLLDAGEDANLNGTLDSEDLNRNGLLDPGEDVDGNGLLDTEDRNGNGALDSGEDSPDGVFTPYCPTDDPNLNGQPDTGEVGLDGGNCRLDPGEDTNGDGVYGAVFPGGNEYLLLNAEYTIPFSDTVELALFYDAGQAYAEDQNIRVDNFRVCYGAEMRFYLPVFQAPIRLIYGFIKDPLPGEDPSNFIFSIGTTF